MQISGLPIAVQRGIHRGRHFGGVPNAAEKFIHVEGLHFGMFDQLVVADAEDLHVRLLVEPLVWPFVVTTFWPLSAVVVLMPVVVLVPIFVVSLLLSKPPVAGSRTNNTIPGDNSLLGSLGLDEL